MRSRGTTRSKRGRNTALGGDRTRVRTSAGLGTAGGEKWTSQCTKTEYLIKSAPVSLRAARKRRRIPRPDRAMRFFPAKPDEDDPKVTPRGRALHFDHPRGAPAFPAPRPRARGSRRTTSRRPSRSTSRAPEVPRGGQVRVETITPSPSFFFPPALFLPGRPSRGVPKRAPVAFDPTRAPPPPPRSRSPDRPPRRVLPRSRSGRARNTRASSRLPPSRSPPPRRARSRPPRGHPPPAVFAPGPRLTREIGSPSNATLVLPLVAPLARARSALGGPERPRR